MNFQTNNIRSFLVLTTLMLLLCFSATSDKAKDKQECTEPLIGLATCLPYVGGTAKSPTTDCCNGLKQLLKTKKKCLCVIVEDRNDPDLGLDINVTLALGLPRACNAPANISECPDLLNLPPNSPDAQIFYQFGQKSSNSSSNSSTPALPNVKPNPPSSTVTPGSSFEQKSGGCESGKIYLGLELIFGGVVLLLSLNLVIM